MPWPAWSLSEGGRRLRLRLERVRRIDTMGVALRGIGWGLAVVLLPVGIVVPAGPQWNAAIPQVTDVTDRGGAEKLPPKARALFGARHDVVLEEHYDPGTRTYFVGVRSHSRAADFIRAQIKDAEMEKQEKAFLYSQGM